MIGGKKPNKWLSSSWQLGIFIALGLIEAIANFGNYAWSQVVNDNTLGSEVTSPIPGDFLIEGGTTRGTNLFHSFSEFSIPTNGIAYFNNDLNIQNIITRVTGGFVSNIDGILSANGTANLFLLNPNGIILSPNAWLDIGGSFIGSTASSLIFADGTQFSATLAQTTPLLTISAPIGLQFRGNPSGIQVQNSNYRLQVPNGKTLALVGGNVELTGAALQAPEGRVELAAVTGSGAVELEVNNGNLRFSVPESLERTDISLDNTEISSFGDGGSITMYSRNLTINNSLVWAAIGQDFGSVSPQTGDITLNATGEVNIGQQSIVANVVLRGITGNTGNIDITAKSLRLSDGVALGTFIFGQGNAGKVLVQAEDSVFLTGNRTILASDVAEGAIGQGGEINIQTGSLSLTENAQIGAITGGRGNAGKIVIQANDSVWLAGKLTGILSNVGENAIGQGGEINIEAGSVFLTDGAGLAASTFGQGDAGPITVKANGAIVLVNGSVSSAVREGAMGQGGKIDIQAGSLVLREGAALDSSTAAQGTGGDINIQVGSLSLANDAVLFADTGGQGNAGNITVGAKDFISLTNSQIYSNVEPGARGQAGNISLQTGSLALIDGSRISNSTFDEGNAGSIFVQSDDSISLIGDTTGIISAVAEDAVGNGGDIQLKARSLSLTNGAQLFANTFGIGNSGNIVVNVSDTVNLSGVGSMTGFSSGFLTNTEEGAEGWGGDITVKTNTLRVSDGAVLSALSRSTFKGGNINVDANTVEVSNGGQLLTTAFSNGDAGNISVHATDHVILSGSDATFTARLAQLGQVDSDGSASGLFARTQGAGAAGNVAINTPRLIVRDRAQVSASTSGGNGGSISIRANRFETLDGGQIRTTTAGSSNAGSINLNVADAVTLAGADSGLFANTDLGSSGNGGSIFMTNPKTIVMEDSAAIAVDSQGTGEGGNVQLQAGSLTLNNNAEISAETASNTGGNINLQVQDLLLMRRSSRISTTAGTTQAGGNGGNIEIDAQFIVAVPKEDSDITANAFTGRGGNINITTQGIYGLQFRPRLTPLSDITASSEFGIDGTVLINTPDVDPSRGLVNLPSEPVTVEVAQDCQAAGKQEAIEFFNTGRGGLAPNPYEPLSRSNIWEDVPSPTQRATNSVSPSTSSATSPNKIVEAQGWIINEKGEVVLVTQMPTISSQHPCRLR